MAFNGEKTITVNTAGILQIPHAKKKKKNEAGLLLNTKDRWIKHLNLRPKAIQLLEETIELKFMTEFDNDFLDMTPKSQVTKEKLDKLALSK